MLNIAKNTFLEIVRNRFLYLIVFFAFVFILFSLALGKLTIGEGNKVIVDFGLAMIEVFGLISVLFVGSQLLFKEIEGKTIFLILSKPIRRSDFILWKYFGFLGVIALIMLLQSGVYLGVLASHRIEITSLILWTLFFTFLKLALLLAIVFFLSTFMGNILSITVALMIYLISQSFSLILDIIAKMGNAFGFKILQVFQLLFPPLEALNTKDFIGSFQLLSPSYFFLNTAYSLVYIGIILILSILIFSRKTFES